MVHPIFGVIKTAVYRRDAWTRVHVNILRQKNIRTRGWV